MRIPGLPSTVLVAPVGFSKTLNASEVATAIGRGLERTGIPIDLCPVEDGGDGTPLAVRSGGDLAPLDRVSFDVRMRSARAVITGERRLDQGSLAGKPLSEVATRARQSGVPCYAVVRSRNLDSFGARILDLDVVLEAGTVKELEAAGRRLAALIKP